MDYNLSLRASINDLLTRNLVELQKAVKYYHIPYKGTSKRELCQALAQEFLSPYFNVAKMEALSDEFGPIILYRIGDPNKKSAFWTPDPKYAYQHLGLLGKQHRAYVDKNARILFKNNDANKKDILKAEKLNYDIIVFPMWDYDSTEWVVINPAVLIRE